MRISSIVPHLEDRKKRWVITFTVVSALVTAWLFERRWSVEGIGPCDTSFHAFVTCSLHWPTWVLFSAVVMMSVGAGELLRQLFQCLEKKISLRAMLPQDNHLVGYVFGVCGVVYAVVLAFVVVTAWQKYDHAGEIVLDEQDAASNIFLIIDGRKNKEWVPDVRSDLRVYAYSMWSEWYVLDTGGELQESDSMPNQSCELKYPSTPWAVDGKTAIENNKNHGLGQRWARCLVQDIGRWKPSSLGDQADYAASITALQHLVDGRTHRIQSAAERLPGIMWSSLVIGATIIVVFTFLFLEQSSWNQRIRTASLSAMLGIMFAEALVFDHPFTGSIRVSDAHWRDLACQFDKQLLLPSPVIQPISVGAASIGNKPQRGPEPKPTGCSTWTPQRILGPALQPETSAARADAAGRGRLTMLR